VADSYKRSTFLKSAFGAGAALGIAVILAIILVVLRLPVISAIYQAHWMQKQVPGLSRTPVPLQDTSAAKMEGANISAFGWTCEAPWAGVATRRKNPLVESTVFENGKSIGFFDPSQIIDTVAGFAQTTKDRARRRQLEAELGKDTVGSDYDLERATLQVTPQDFSIFMSNKRARGDATLLWFKYLTNSDAETGLFSFSFENLRGFQLGDPARARSVVIHGYDRQDRGVEIFIKMGDGKLDHILQIEINRVLQTLHWTGDTEQPSSPLSLPKNKSPRP
jgi:hypothetical protein